MEEKEEREEVKKPEVHVHIEERPGEEEWTSDFLHIMPNSPLMPKIAKKKKLQHLHSLHDIGLSRRSSVNLNNFDMIMENNKRWAKEMLEEDSEYFSALVAAQKP
jgi:hypothetical protein